MSRRFSLIITLLCCSFLVNIMAQEPLDLSGCETQAALICDVESGEIIFEHNAEKNMTPASLTKLVTTAAVMTEVGSTQRFSTQAFLSSDGATLYIKGSCDPTFNSKYFAWHTVEAFASDIANSLKQKGVTQIKRVVIDKQNEPRPLLPSKRLWEDMGNYFGSVPHSLNYADNTFTLSLKSPQTIDSQCKIIGTNPVVDKDFECFVRSSASNADSAYIYGTDGDATWYVSGSIPAGREKFDIKGALPNPETYFCNELIKAVKASGLSVSQEIALGEAPSDAVLITESTSPTIEAIAQQTNKRSINLFADALLIKMCSAPEPSWDQAIARLNAFCRKASSSRPTFYDGSGLSPMNAVTARLMTDVLVYMHRSPLREKYRGTLSKAGTDGTLRNFGTGTKLEGRVWGKTGTMNGVVGIAGYAENAKGRIVAFCIIVNGQEESAKIVRHKMSAWLVERLGF